MVKDGYKETEIGLIPIDWNIDILGNIVDFEDSKRVPIKDVDRKKMQGIFPYYGASGIIDYVNQYIFDGEYILLGEDGANIMDRSSRLAFVIKGKCWINNHAHVMKPNHGIDIYYLAEYLESISYDSYNTGTAQPKLNRNKCNKIPVPIPSFPEQIVISTALSDTDKLISSLEKLIAKKQAIKQGAMQDLLTGRTRLKGFDEKWKILNLAANSKIKARIGWHGLTTEEYLNEGYAYLITGTDFQAGRIKWESCHFVNYERYIQDVNIQLKIGDILLTKDGTIGKVAYIDKLKQRATLNSGVFLIRAKMRSYNEQFVYYILQSSIFIEFLNKLSAGSTINHLYQKDLVKFEFLIPPTIEEQKCIALCLYNMDIEIYALQQKAAKYRQIKQGMMSELLTGRIRLKEA